MSGPNRRTFLGGAAALAACRGGADPSGPCGDDLPGGTFLGTFPFVDEDARLETRTGEGLDARYAVDLETLGPDDLVIPADRFYLRTGEPLDLGPAAAWTIRIGGRVEAEATLGIDALLARVEPIGVVLLECSGNGAGAGFGLIGAGDFAGVPLAWALGRATPTSEAARIRITGRDTHPPSAFSTAGASWVFAPEDLEGAWLVTHQDGEPIPADHGAPVRLLVPGWYGCANVKWVDAIDHVPDDEPATSQMTEFAARTHQDGVPALARDHRPATMELSAVVARVESWDLDGDDVIRVVGIVWGGTRDPDVLRLWSGDEDLGPVSFCARRDVCTWGLWEAFLPENARGVVTLRLTAEGVPARRLDSRFYDRQVDLG